MSTDVMDEVGTPPFPDLETTQTIDDSEAPWGRRVDGTPKAKPGAKGTGTPRKAAPPRPRKAASSTRTSKAKAGDPDYRPALIALFSLPTFLTSIAARGVKDEKQKTALMLDGLTFKVHGPNMAEALNETAKTQAALASLLDKVVSAGPYGLVAAAGIPIVMQIFANHRMIEPNESMGILPPETLVKLASDDAGPY